MAKFALFSLMPSVSHGHTTGFTGFALLDLCNEATSGRFLGGTEKAGIFEAYRAAGIFISASLPLI